MKAIESQHVGLERAFFDVSEPPQLEGFFHSRKFRMFSLDSVLRRDNWSLSPYKIPFSVFPSLRFLNLSSFFPVDFLLFFSVFILKHSTPKITKFYWCLIINNYSTIVITHVLLYSNHSYFEGRSFFNRTSPLSPLQLIISTQMILTLYFCIWSLLH